MFTIRERPTTTYGSLGTEHHGNVRAVLKPFYNDMNIKATIGDKVVETLHPNGPL